MNRQLLQEAHDAIEAFTDPQGHMPEDTGEFRDLSKVLVNLKAALSQPTPQGVAEVMELVDELSSTRFVEGIDGDDTATERARALVEQAITAVITERDTLRAKIAELEKDAARYQFWRNRWGDEQFLSTLAGTIRQLSDPLIRGDYNNLDIVSDAAIAAQKNCGEKQ